MATLFVSVGQSISRSVSESANFERHNVGREMQNFVLFHTKREREREIVRFEPKTFKIILH